MPAICGDGSKVLAHRTWTPRSSLSCLAWAEQPQHLSCHSWLKRPRFSRSCPYLFPCLCSPQCPVCQLGGTVRFSFQGCAPEGTWWLTVHRDLWDPHLDQSQMKCPARLLHHLWKQTWDDEEYHSVKNLIKPYCYLLSLQKNSKCDCRLRLLLSSSSQPYFMVIINPGRKYVSSGKVSRTKVTR